VLAVDAKNVKALFRRGKAHAALKEFEKAKQDLSAALQLENSPEIKQELKSVEALEQKVTASEKKLYSNLFNQLSKEPLYKPEEEPSGTKMKKCSICGEEVEEIQLARHVIKKHSQK
jgi:FK506-binding protein 4/5